ncbi:MAG: hypothetical protein ABI543_11615 [Ignavibacteria bacterium]
MKVYKIAGIIIIFIIMAVSNVLYSQRAFIVSKTDSDSLWQIINDNVTLEYDVVVIKSINKYGFVLSEGWKEYYCNTNTISEEFWVKLKKRKEKLI